jgi:hypothetical protein
MRARLSAAKNGAKDGLKTPTGWLGPAKTIALTHFPPATAFSTFARSRIIDDATSLVRWRSKGGFLREKLANLGRSLWSRASFREQSTTTNRSGQKNRL